MKKKRLWILIALALLLMLTTVLSGCGEKGDGEAVNFDFSGVSGTELPNGWVVKSYENQYSLDVRDGVIMLSSEIADDLRVVYTMDVSENTNYVLRCEARSETVADGRGASLSIDNYDIDKSCVYSSPLTGDSDWTSLELAFSTIENQTKAVLALRLGGYSEASSGKVFFRNVSFVQSSNSELDYQPLNPWGGSGSDAKVKNEEELKAFFAVILWATVIAGVVMIAGIFANRKQIIAFKLSDKNYKVALAIMIFIGIFVRFVLCAIYKGHDTDMSCWISWGSMIANGEFSTFYVGTWYEYPPGYMIVLGLLTTIMRFFGINASSVVGLFCYQIPPILGDLGCMLLLLKVAKSKGLSNSFKLMLATLVFLNPAAGFLSGAWSQIDSVLTFFLILSFLLINDNKRILAGIVYAVAILFKWQALMFGPVLAIVYLLSIKDRKDIINTAIGVVSAIALILLVSIPFKGTQDFLWLPKRFITAHAHYDYASVEAYNFVALCGGNWPTEASAGFIGPLTYKAFGWLAIVASVVICAWQAIKSRKRQLSLKMNLLDEKGLVFLLGGFCMAMIFTFGHYMHERYVFPVLFLLLFAYVYYRDWRLLLVSILFTLTTFLNEMNAMFVVSNWAASVVRSGREHNDIIRFCSAAETAAFIYFGWVMISRGKETPKSELKSGSEVKG